MHPLPEKVQLIKMRSNSIYNNQNLPEGMKKSAMSAGVLCTGDVSPVFPALTGKREKITGRWVPAKMLLVMKLTVLMLTVTFLSAYAEGTAQSVTLKGKDLALKEVFSAISEQTDYIVFYNQRLLEGTKPVSLAAKDLPLKELLAVVFRDQPLDYVIEDKTIILSRKPWITSTGKPDTWQDSLKGRVLRAGSGEQLAGVTIAVKGAGKGMISNATGHFAIGGVNDKAVVVITSVGFTPLEIAFSKLAALPAGETIVLNESSITKMNDGSFIFNLTVKVNPLEEVVINGGYYATNEKARTGNIARVSGKDIKNQPVTSPLMSLQGRMAGVSVTPYSGVPGSAPNIQIRGQNSLRFDGSYPLYVIDGIPVDSRPIAPINTIIVYPGFDPLATLNPADIESIDVLKDADATAIYGSRGANGVVLITTRKGVARKTAVDINIYRGSGRLSHKLDMLNFQEYFQLRKEAFANDGLTPRSTDYDMTVFDTTGRQDKDWQEEMLGGSSGITDINIGASGGNGQTAFNASLGYHKETTIYGEDFGFTRMNMHFGVTHQSANKKLQIMLKGDYGMMKNNLFADANFTFNITRMPPNSPDLYTQEGKLNWLLVYPYGPDFPVSAFNNPAAYLLKTHDVKQFNFVSSLSASYQLTNDLQLKVSMGLTDLREHDNTRDPIAALNPTFIYAGVTGSAGFASNQRTSWIVEPQLSYGKTFGLHGFNLVAGSTFQDAASYREGINAYGYTSDAMLGSVLAAPTKYYDVTEGHYRFNSVFARLGYNWGQRVFLNFTGRRDGSSRFGPHNRYANFGAIGAAWEFSESHFFDDIRSVINRGKLRGSYGITGNDLIGDFEYLKSYTVTNAPYMGYPGLYPRSLYNPGIRWEQTRKLEFSLALGFLQDRITTEVSWYRNRSSNQLIDYALPWITGFNSVRANFPAVIENRGLEIVLETKNIQRKDITWITSFNVTVPQTKLVAFDNIENSSYASFFKVGEAPTVQYLYTWDGVDPATGIHKLKDINNDGAVDDNDRRFMLPTGQKIFGGLGNSVRWKDLEVAAFLYFANTTTSNIYPSTSLPGSPNNWPAMALDRWMKPGDQKMIGRSSTRFNNDYSNKVIYSDYNTTDIFFVRLRSLEIAYQLNSLLNRTVPVQASVFVQGQNLLTFTDFKLGWDPETMYNLPALRMLSAGLRFKM